MPSQQRALLLWFLWSVSHQGWPHRKLQFTPADRHLCQPVAIDLPSSGQRGLELEPGAGGSAHGPGCSLARPWGRWTGQGLDEPGHCLLQSGLFRTHGAFQLLSFRAALT